MPGADRAAARPLHEEAAHEHLALYLGRPLRGPPSRASRVGDPGDEPPRDQTPARLRGEGRADRFPFLDVLVEDRRAGLGSSSCGLSLLDHLAILRSGHRAELLHHREVVSNDPMLRDAAPLGNAVDVDVLDGEPPVL
jgi:hypothetical protein